MSKVIIETVDNGFIVTKKAYDPEDRDEKFVIEENCKPNGEAFAARSLLWTVLNALDVNLSKHGDHLNIDVVNYDEMVLEEYDGSEKNFKTTWWRKILSWFRIWFRNPLK
jgi:hypothetical protein